MSSHQRHDISSFGIDRLADVTMSIVHVHFIAVISMEIDEYHPDPDPDY